MPIKFEFELGDEDLAYFKRIIQERQLGMKNIELPDIVEATSTMLGTARDAGTPPFILEKLEVLEELIQMVTDDEWRLPAEDIDRVLHALAYFADPEDLIPDNVPGLGFLDDAVMVELAARDLQPEIEAYRDFCEFREAETARRSATGEDRGPVSRVDWLESQRRELLERMHRRRRRLFGGQFS